MLMVRIVSQVVQSVWARSTWANRIALWERWRNYHATHQMVSTDASMTAFVETRQVLPQTKFQYARELAALAARFRMPDQILRLYIHGQQARWAAVPLRQAVPATRLQIARLMSLLQPRDATAVFLAWKSASRWNDVQQLCRENFVKCDDQAIIIRWGVTKTTRRQPYQPHQYTVVIDQNMSRHVNTIRRLRPRESLTKLSTQQLVERMKSDPELSALGAHSIKRHHPADTACGTGEARPKVDSSDGQTPRPIARFPVSTLRYAADPLMAKHRDRYAADPEAFLAPTEPQPCCSLAAKKADFYNPRAAKSFATTRRAYSEDRLRCCPANGNI